MNSCLIRFALRDVFEISYHSLTAMLFMHLHGVSGSEAPFTGENFAMFATWPCHLTISVQCTSYRTSCSAQLAYVCANLLYPRRIIDKALKGSLWWKEWDENETEKTDKIALRQMSVALNNGFNRIQLQYRSSCRAIRLEARGPNVVRWSLRSGPRIIPKTVKMS